MPCPYRFPIKYSHEHDRGTFSSLFCLVNALPVINHCLDLVALPISFLSYI